MMHNKELLIPSTSAPFSRDKILIKIGLNFTNVQKCNRVAILFRLFGLRRVFGVAT